MDLNARDHRRHDRTRDAVALVLAVGLSFAMVMLMFGVVWDAVRSDTPGISENSTQIITTAFGGIIGVLGSYLGYRAGAAGTSKGDNNDEHLSAGDDRVDDQ